MKIEIDDNVIERWEDEAKENKSEELEGEHLAPFALKEMIEEWLWDYFE